MKKFTLIIVLGLVICLLCSCGGNDLPDNITTTESQSTEEQNDLTINANIDETQSSQETTEAENATTSPIGGDDEFTLDDLPMRYIYYSLSESYANLVENQEEFDEWYMAREISDDMDEMLYVSFVKRFNISREDFDKATEERIRIITDVRGRTPVTPPFDTAHEAELCEVPNADVIYTFDNEFIKEYYKRENANVTLEIPTTVETSTVEESISTER